MRVLTNVVATGAVVLITATACSSGGTPAGATAAGGGSATPAATLRPASSSDSESPASGQANAACSGDDIAAALQAAAKAASDADSYRVNGTATTSAGEQVYTLEFAKPDRVHAVLGSVEYVAIGAKTWQKTGGQWQSAPGVDLSRLTAGMGQLNQEILNDATFTDVSVDTNEDVDGQPAVLYRYHESIPSELEADSQMWLDPASCRPIKNVATGTASSTTTQFEATYSDWGNVTVQAPS